MSNFLTFAINKTREIGATASRTRPKNTVETSVWGFRPENAGRMIQGTAEVIGADSVRERTLAVLLGNKKKTPS
jgi:hypothetical protein